MKDVEKQNPLFLSIKEIVVHARKQAYRANNSILLSMYWEIGRLIVEDEQEGKAKATYGKATLKNLSRQLTQEFGSGFDESNLRNIRQFYLAFPNRDAVRTELSWTHYRMRMNKFFYHRYTPMSTDKKRNLLTTLQILIHSLKGLGYLG